MQKSLALAFGLLGTMLTPESGGMSPDFFDLKQRVIEQPAPSEILTQQQSITAEISRAIEPSEEGIKTKQELATEIVEQTQLLQQLENSMRNHSYHVALSNVETLKAELLEELKLPSDIDDAQLNIILETKQSELKTSLETPAQAPSTEIVKISAYEDALIRLELAERSFLELQLKFIEAREKLKRLEEQAQKNAIRTVAM